ncbi:MAG: hypothetical protein ACYC75_03165 [Minisyncoccota bacterium]
MKTEVQLEDLADKWMTKVIAMSSILDEQIHEGIRLGTNLDTRKVRGLTYLVIVAFGSYVIQQKVLSDIGFDRKEEFANFMREKYLSIQKAITKGNHDEKWLATTKDAYDGPFKKMTSMKGPVANYLKQSLAAIFAGYTDIEFVEDSFFSRLKLSSKHRVSMKILDELVLSIWAQFMDLEVDSIQK